mmetsp:Transcript_66303/g.176899  ORF Transcript_66303/g.176899 Transcript_66303/m.176899 type:complete len:208 (+) Transcript_66303:266-889(+)
MYCSGPGLAAEGRNRPRSHGPGYCADVSVAWSAVGGDCVPALDSAVAQAAVLPWAAILRAAQCVRETRILFRLSPSQSRWFPQTRIPHCVVLTHFSSTTWAPAEWKATTHAWELQVDPQRSSSHAREQAPAPGTPRHSGPDWDHGRCWRRAEATLASLLCAARKAPDHESHPRWATTYVPSTRLPWSTLWSKNLVNTAPVGVDSGAQ